MYKILSALFLSVILVSGCNSATGEVAENTIPAPETDTTIFLTINSVKTPFRVKKSLRRYLKKFQAFLDEYPKVPAVYTDTVMVDITGDGENEKVITRITCDHIDCTIFSTVLAGETVIFSDTLPPNDGISYLNWEEDSIYFKLKPYSTFFDALGNKQLISDPENGRISEDLIEFYTGPIRWQLKETASDSLLAVRTIDSIKQELRHYKGKYLTPLTYWGGDLYFWNRFTKRFELLYSP